MSSRRAIAPEFPDAEAKLQKAIARKSAFEKQKAEAEAKRQREAAETAAVYEDFVKSLGHGEEREEGEADDDYDDGYKGRFGGTGGFNRGGVPGPGKAGGMGGSAASRRHFVQGSALKRSGPGSLGPSPGGFGKKRGFDSFHRDGRERIGSDRGILGFEDVDSGGPKTIAKVFHASDDEEDHKASADKEEDIEMVARPTLRLIHLPPGTSPAVVKALVPNLVTVENVKILPQAVRGGTERKCTVAIATLSQDTPANDIDTVVSQLQNRYLGFGYYLSIHRHLSSAVTTATATAAISSSSTSHPFGARPVSQAPTPGGNLQQNAFHRGFAPPTSYGQPLGINRNNLLHVPVQPPQDIKTIQMINMVLESVLEHGPEFEALLMTRPDVQKEEKWAWLWDSRSEGGVWYRWRLWQIFTGAKPVLGREKYHPLFEDSHAWKEPSKTLPFEFVIDLDEMVSASDYNSSEDEDFEGEGKDNQGGEVEKTFLNPLEKAKLAHLLSRLPTTLSNIRKGDVARIAAFAITHASRGADEVVDMIVSNVHTPYALSGANPSKKQDARDRDTSPEAEEKTGGAEGVGDTSGASLVGLYVVSDILSSSSTSGIRHAWRFRQLFETALKERKTFDYLGMMATRHSWGRLRAEKWKRSVSLILNLWEGWCVFPAEGQELFVRSFENPPDLQAQDQSAEDTKEHKWKTVDAVAASKVGDALPESKRPEEDAEGEPMEEEEGQLEEEPIGVPMEEFDIESEPMQDDEDVAGEPMGEDDVAGEVMQDDAEEEPTGDDDAEGLPMDEDSGGEAMEEDSESDQQGDAKKNADHAAAKQERSTQPSGTLAGLKFSANPAGRPRARMKAVDLFADSDGSDGGH